MHTVSKHHYAMLLARRGAAVFFLNPPDDSCNGISIVNVDGYPGLRVVSAPKVASGLRFYPGILRCWLERLWLSHFEKTVGKKIDTIWLFENSRFFDMRFAGGRLKIYHQVDLNQEFNPEIAAMTADICFCTTDIIKQRLLSFNSRVYKIHHGLPEVKNGKSLTNDQVSRFDRNVPHAIYIGNLDMMYLDAELLVSVVNKFIDVQFHFVGGYSENGVLKRLSDNLPNAIWWGRVDSALIPKILDYADILLVLYKADHYKDQASPHKFMEYLASGKVIVATYTEEYIDKRHLLEMVVNSKEFSERFGKVINNLSFYNSEEKQRERISFANDNTYSKQLYRVISHLQQHGLLL